MPKSSRDRRKAKKEQKRHTALVARVREQRAATSYTAWPIIRAYVPLDDCIRATGCGSVAIARQRPDGKIITAFLDIELIHGGVVQIFGKDDHKDMAEVEKLVSDLGKMVPPMSPGDAELAGRYAWGAYSWSIGRRFDFSAEAESRYLALFPRPSGTRNWCSQQFIGPRGLLPGALEDVIERNLPDDDLPDDKEVMVFTTATFDVDDHQAVSNQLRSESPEFNPVNERDGAVTFDYSRVYPKNHWSPLARLGGRQSLGSVVVNGDSLVAECKTLSMTARLITKLKDLFAETIRLRGTKWKGCDELLAEAKNSAGLLDIDPSNPAA